MCGLLLLQYAHRRKPFILAWAAGWLMLTPAYLVLSPAYASVRVAFGALQKETVQEGIGRLVTGLRAILQ